MTASQALRGGAFAGAVLLIALLLPDREPARRPAHGPSAEPESGSLAPRVLEASLSTASVEIRECAPALDECASDGDFVARLEPATVLVRVRRAETGAAVSDYELHCEVDGRTHGPTIRTDEDGQARFDNLSGFQADVRGLLAGARRIALEPGRTHEVELVLDAGLALVVDVRDPAGLPIADAEVRVVPHFARFDLPLVGRTDRNGTLALDGVEVGRALVVSKPGFAVSPRYPLHANFLRDGRLNVDLVPESARLDVRIVALETRMPIAGARLGLTPYALPNPDHRPPFAHVKLQRGTRHEDSDASGLVRLDGLAPIPHHVRVEAPGFAPRELDTALLADRTNQLEVELAPGFDVWIRPVDGDGRSLRAALVTLRGDETELRAAGELGPHRAHRFPAVERGSYEIEVLAADGHEGRLEWSCQASGMVVVPCARDGAIELHVGGLDPDGGRVFVFGPAPHGTPLPLVGVLDDSATTVLTPTELSGSNEVAFSRDSSPSWCACAVRAIDARDGRADLALDADALATSWLEFEWSETAAAHSAPSRGPSEVARPEARLFPLESNVDSRWRLRADAPNRLGPLAPGDYRLELRAASDAEWVAWGRCSVAPGDNSLGRLDFPARD